MTPRQTRTERLAKAVILARQAFLAKEPTKDFLKRLQDLDDLAREMLSDRALKAVNDETTQDKDR